MSHQHDVTSLSLDLVIWPSPLPFSSREPALEVCTAMAHPPKEVFGIFFDNLDFTEETVLGNVRG